MANIVQTSGGPGEGVPEVLAPQPNLAESCKLQFDAFNDKIKDKLHASYHSGQESFREFARLRRFEQNELQFLKVLIERKYAQNGCPLCNHEATKHNCDKIDTYFNDTLRDILNLHHEHIMTEYKDKSTEKFVNIHFKDITGALDDLLTHCYDINECNKEQEEKRCAPQMEIIQTNDDDLKAMILDEDTETAAAYDILINDANVVSYDNNNNNNNNNQFNIKYDFKPFTKYSFRVRKYTNNEYSDYSEPIHVTTDFKCIWSQKNHGKNVHFASNNKYICCKSNNGDCTVLCDDKYVIDSMLFKEIAFVFKMEQLAQDSYFGFIDYANGMDTITKFDTLIHKNEFSYCLCGHHASYDMNRYICGESQGTKGRWSGAWSASFKLQNKMNIKHGDRFIFVVNFDAMCCNVFINEIKDEYKISPSGSEDTFTEIPGRILPFYCHEHTQYGAAHSKVSISVYNRNGYHYQLR